MSYLVVTVVAFVASGLTFFSGFGLGTLLLPAFALFFSAELAVAMTAAVHFLNSLFKPTSLPAMPTSALSLASGCRRSPPRSWERRPWSGPSGGGPSTIPRVLGREAHVTAVKLVVGLQHRRAPAAVARRLLLEVFAAAGAAGRGAERLFGGLSGMQGALRSAFLVRAGLSTQAFIGRTGVVVASLVDLSRLGVCTRRALAQESASIDYGLLSLAVLAALSGSFRTVSCPR